MADDLYEDITTFLADVSVSKDALKAVLPQIVPRMAHKWDSIGIQLTQAERVSQLRNSPEPNEKKMQDILDAWIESEDRFRINTAPLLNSLRSSDVGLHDVAEDLDKAAEEEDVRRRREALQRRREALQRRREEEARQELQRAYKESLDKHGSVSVEVTPCVIVGSSATGKSSLKHLLVHDTPKAVKTSTAVIDTPAVITVSSEQYAVERGTSAWQLVDSDVMGKSIQEYVTAKAYDDGQYPELPQSKAEQSDQKMKDEAAPLPFTSQQKRQNPMQKFIKRVQQMLQHASAKGTGDSEIVALLDAGLSAEDTGDSKIVTVLDAGLSAEDTGDSKIVAVLDEGLSAFLHDVRVLVQSINLKNASFIHLLDTGGQPSFQDALPLLLDVPCTYIQVFNAAQDLDQPVPITYRRDDHTEESLPPSTETGWEMMLRSFSSMHTMAHKSSKELPSFQQEESQLPQLRIFLVGTFKDQVVEEGRLKEAVQDISKRLRELEGKPYYRCIQKDTAGQPCYLINNMADKEDDRADVNSLREHLSSTRSSLKLKVPVMWYICEQITQGSAQKFFRFQDLKAFCLKQKFIGANGADEQFRSLLKLFSLLGFYAFFDLKNVPHEANYVCTDKGVFVREVSKLLAVQFLQAPRCHSVEVFQQNGIISNNAELFEELGIMEEVDRSWFLAALEHVGLLARYASATDHSTSYFMPIALPQGKTKLPDCGSVASLCVTFTFHSPDNPLVYSDLPRGVFCRLAVELSKGPWKPAPKESDRTTVKFLSEKFDLYLTEAPGFIRLTPVLAVELEGKEQLAELHTLCREIYNTLQKSMHPSAVDVLGEQFSRTAKVTFGLECGCGKVPHLATPVAATGKSLICQFTQKRHNSLKKEQIWFSPVENTELVEVAGCDMWVMEQIDSPSSDPPQTGHPRHKVHAQQYPISSLERSAVSPQKYEETAPPQPTPQPPQPTPQPLWPTPQPPQPTPRPPQPTPQPPQPTPQPPWPTPQPPQRTPHPPQPTPHPPQPTPHPPQPTPHPPQPTPQPPWPTPQPPQPTPQPPRPTPQPPQPTPQPPQPTPQPPQPNPWPPQPNPWPPQPNPWPPWPTPQPPQPTPQPPQRTPDQDSLQSDDAILSHKVYDHPCHLMLLRKYVSRRAAGKGRAVLEGVWLDAPTIAACFTAHPMNEEGAVQEGLTKWCGGKGFQPPTWGVLVEAIEFAELAQQDIDGLKVTLALSASPRSSHNNPC